MGFEELQKEIMVWLNTLSCAAAALDRSWAVDQDEISSRARAVVHACDEHLHRLMDWLEQWEMTTRPQREVRT